MLEGHYVPYCHANSTEADSVDLTAPTPYREQYSTLQPDQKLPTFGCLEDYFALGSPCPGPPHAFDPGSDIGQNDDREQMDLVYAYVNGSDPLHQYHHRKAKQAQATPDSVLVAPQSKGFNILREFDELRFSVRSVLEHFRGSAKGVTVVASEYPFPGCDDSGGAGNWTLGQVPQWLDTSVGGSSWVNNGVGLRVIHHSTAFGASYDPKQPVFNSLAIESKLGSLTDISDYFIYMNDDIFLNRPLSTYDFYRPSSGPIFRMQSDLLITPQRPRDGEWAALIYTNELLDSRFGSRSRPYLTHTAKTLSKTMLEEIAAIWSDELGRTERHQFRVVHRRDEDVEYDVSTTYLMTHYVVERWREALLWSFIVARTGGDDDEWGEEHTNRVWQELGTTPDAYTPAVVIRGRRETLEKTGDDGIVAGNETKILFSSLDGYPYSNMGRSGFVQLPDLGGDDAARARHLAGRCRLERSCLEVGASSTASDVFKNVAFRLPSCGDCIISALVTQSGTSGLSAFLPDPRRNDPARSNKPDGEVSSPVVAQLPLAKEWQTSDFTLVSVMAGSHGDHDGEGPGISVREWAMRAMYRYRFAIGATKATFMRLDTPVQVKVALDRMDSLSGEEGDPALVCINDDVRWQPDVVKDALQSWMKRKWRRPAGWEVQ